MAQRPVGRPARHITSAPSAGCVVVPAAPGYSVLCFTDDGGDGIVTETPIVAWRIEQNCATPITPDPDGIVDEPNMGIEAPNGSITLPGFGYFRNEGEWLEYVREVNRKRA